MLEIDDNLNIKNDNIVYYQLSNGEQLDLNSESNLPQIVYDAVIDKKNNHKLFLDESQSDSDKDSNARWILDIQLQSVLRDYIFATMKKWRTVEGVKNNMTMNNNVNASIKEYIDKNVLSRYKFTKVELFLQPVDLLTIGGLKYGNSFDVTIESPTTIYTKFQTETDNLSYLSSSAHTGGEFTETNKSVSNENPHTNQDSIHTSDINMVSEY
jgi:hypothetical protein